jgi:hypothetical protein
MPKLVSFDPVVNHHQHEREQRDWPSPLLSFHTRRRKEYGQYTTTAGPGRKYDHNSD